MKRDLQARVDAESNVVQELNKMQSAHKNAEKMVTTQSETIKVLKVENQNLKERVETNKKKRKDIDSVLNEYDERLKVNTVKEFVHSSKFEVGLARVIGPWFKNGFSCCTAQIKDLMQKAGQSLSILKGLNIGRKIEFPAETFVSYPDNFLPSHTSNAKLPSRFKFLKDWSEEEDKKD
ncbi:hypothetical protein Dimus_022610 [Dionaea muscipula]